MNIKEIAEKLAPHHWHRDTFNIEYFDVTEFAESLLAEVQRQNVAVPVNCWWEDSEYQVDDPESHAYECQMEVGDEFELSAAYYVTEKFKVTGIDEHGAYQIENIDPTKLFTFPPSLEAEREKVAEACALMLESDANTLASTCGYEDMGSLSFGRGEHAEAKMDRYKELLELAEAIRSGEWRRFVK